MKARTLLRYVGGTLAATMVAAGIGLSSPAYGNFQQFFTPAGSTAGGQPVSAEADFTTSAGLITLTLINLQASPVSIIQAISDIFFKATTAGVVATDTGAGQFNAAGNYINISGTGVVSGAGTNLYDWQLTNSSGTYYLNKLWAGNPVVPGSAPKGLVIGPGPYCGGGGDGSICGNSAHNPFADQTVTFSLALAGITDATIISDVVFSFGTTPGTNVAVPIPAAVWLFVSGLLGLIAIGRRKLGVAPVAA